MTYQELKNEVRLWQDEQGWHIYASNHEGTSTSDLSEDEAKTIVDIIADFLTGKEFIVI